MRRCPNCRRPVDATDEVCDFCDELLMDKNQGGNSGKSKYNQTSQKPHDTHSPSRRQQDQPANRSNTTSQAPPRQQPRQQTSPRRQGQQSGQPQQQQNPSPQQEPPQYNQAQQPQQPHNHPTQHPGNQRNNKENTVSRRGLLVGGLGLAGVLGAGWVFLGLNGSEDGPEQVAEDFVSAIDDGDLTRADEMIHPDSPLDGAGQAADLLIIAAAPGADQVIDTLSISVTKTEVIERANNEAIVDTTIQVDLIVREVSATVPLKMRTNNDSWYVENVDVNTI